MHGTGKVKPDTSYLILLSPVIMIPCQDADGLQRLPQSHVITEDAMQLVLIQECQPVHTRLKYIIRTLTYLWLTYGVSSADYTPLNYRTGE
jgi:hypothetical protein